MKNRILIIGYFLLFITYSFRSNSQDLDSSIHLPKNEFFRSFIEKGNNGITLKIPDSKKLTTINTPVLKTKWVYLLKNQKGAFLVFDGSSRVYKYLIANDSTYRFDRIDQVENINYNINAHYFSFKNELYNYGGYGFWKSNGLLRKFNVKNKEWDIVPLNQEIHSDQEFSSNWMSPVNQNVFILFEHKVNEGIKQSDKLANRPQPHTYQLDLNTKKVEYNGKINEVLIPVFLKSNKLHTHEGIILARVDQSYYVKPDENKLYIIEDESIIQSLGRLEWNTLYFFSDQHFHYWDFEKNKYDSIDIRNIKLKPVGKIWAADYSMYYFVAAVLMLVMIIVVLWRLFNKKKTTIVLPATTPVEKGNVIQVPLTSETEIALIKLLIEKTQLQEFASSNEINYIIGCKDKNVGLQKKMRSDIINSINTKYKAFSKTDQNLIESKRTELDKRYFHYHITDDQLEKAKVFIELTAV